ncbi:MAG: shikimate kinase [Phormidesmis sp.]
MSAVNADFLKKTNLYLIGMMGAGKTTIGRKLAKRLNYRFLDTDALIEQSADKPISEIFATAGEAAFRALETQVLAQVCAHTGLVVATGGGIVTQQMNWSYLHHGVVIWLDVPIVTLVSRLSDDTSRPLLQQDDLSRPLLKESEATRLTPEDPEDVELSNRLESLMAQRADLYAQADIRIAYEGRSVGKTCDRIITALQQNLRPDAKLSADQITINQASIN